MCPQSCPVPREGLLSEQGKGCYRCWEVLKLRHKPQTEKLLRWTAQSVWWSWVEMSTRDQNTPMAKCE